MQGMLKKNRKGFTLIEILIVVVIVAILAAISVPIYLDYVAGARASDAQSQIGAIYNAAKMYKQDTELWPADVQELEDRGYLTIDESVKLKWNFDITEEQITATSTDEMAGGSGKEVRYDILQGKFFGYGLPNDDGDN